MCIVYTAAKYVLKNAWVVGGITLFAARKCRLNKQVTQFTCFMANTWNIIRTGIFCY